MHHPTATKVLVIGYVWPEPRSSAASGHVMQILDTFLGQGWDITFSSPAGPAELFFHHELVEQHDVRRQLADEGVEAAAIAVSYTHLTLPTIYSV